MKTRFQCLYCGNEWERDWYGGGAPTKCEKCGDKQVKARKAGKKVDYYSGDVPEVERETESPYEFQD